LLGGIFEQLREYEPSHVDDHFNLGVGLQGKVEIEGVIVNPYHRFRRYNLGTALHSKVDLVSARKVHKKALMLIP